MSLLAIRTILLVLSISFYTSGLRSEFPRDLRNADDCIYLRHSHDRLPMANSGSDSLPRLRDTSYKGLYIGDTIADQVLGHTLNYPSDHLKISDFKGKILILDFWHTYCSSCLVKFPGEDSLQKAFPSDLQFLLVDGRNSRDDSTRIRYVLQNLNRPINLPMLYDDSLLSMNFPHHSSPHYAWLDRNGVVMALTGGEAVTPENVARAVRDGHIELPISNLGPQHTDWFEPISPDQARITLYGTVFSVSGEPIDDARMRWRKGGSTSGTNRKGMFVIVQREPTDVLEVTRQGFKTLRIRITPTTPLPLHIVMGPV
jgi:thiol-disulfide isomerase/thioredoxin